MKAFVLKKMFKKNQSIPPSENNLWHLYLDVMLLLTKTVMANKAY